MYRTLAEEMEYDQLTRDYIKVNTHYTNRHLYGGFEFYYLPEEETYIKTSAITMFDSGAHVPPTATRYRLTRYALYADINGVWVAQ